MDTGFLLDFLVTVMMTAGTAFAVFLMGYASYSLVKRGQRRRLEKERQSALRSEQQFQKYIDSLDNDLKREIDAAVRQHNRENGIVDNNDVSSDILRNKIKAIVLRGYDIFMEKGTEKYHKLNNKYEFDKDGQMFEEIKNKVADKLLQSIDRFGDKKRH